MKAIQLPEGLNDAEVQGAVEHVNDFLTGAFAPTGAVVIDLEEHVVWNCSAPDQDEGHEADCYRETRWWQTAPEPVEEEGVEDA